MSINPRLEHALAWVKKHPPGWKPKYPRKAPKLPRPVIKAKTKTTTVYVLGCEGYYKIGIGNPAHRISDMQTGNPFLIRLIGTIQAEDAYKLEQALHKQFKQYRVRGEWFDLRGASLETLLAMLCHVKL